MADTVIRVENLSKQYRLGAINHGTLRADLASWWARLRGQEDPNLRIGSARQPEDMAGSPDRFWALKDVSFEVRQGEVLGIIGKNGAGKSTLLKILSRVTTPTRGQIKVRGRIASLLEVGTGFHPELSGRENIFLNGAILGMRKDEIRRKLDEIIAFAEVEKFIDTPVKRYSSGMYVRLAFAVAAHLEPEILVVDEVLAVGDAEFQKKCLGKMSDVASHGRTVLFVSHNMQAVQSLCTRCCLLTQGKKVAEGLPEMVVNEYLNSTDDKAINEWADPVGLGGEQARLKRIAVYSEKAENQSPVFHSKNDLQIELEVVLESVLSGLCIGYDLFDESGAIVLRSYNTDVSADMMPPVKPGINILRCSIPKGLLNAGRYYVAPRIGIHNQMWIVHSDPLISFSMTLTHGVSPFWNSLSEGSRPGAIAPILHWTAN